MSKAKDDNVTVIGRFVLVYRGVGQYHNFKLRFDPRLLISRYVPPVLTSDDGAATVLWISTQGETVFIRYGGTVAENSPNPGPYLVNSGDLNWGSIENAAGRSWTISYYGAVGHVIVPQNSGNLDAEAPFFQRCFFKLRPTGPEVDFYILDEDEEPPRWLLVPAEK